MPELAFVFIIGVLLSLVTGSCFTYLYLSKYKSPHYIVLQKNLIKINLRWNDLEGCTENFIEEANELEYVKARSTYMIFSLVCVILSWLGFVLLLIMWVSIEKLIKNKIEKEIFASEMVLKDLNSEQVLQRLEKISMFK